jgi:hypothetical protein
MPSAGSGLPIDVEGSTHHEPILMPTTACPSPTVMQHSLISRPRVVSIYERCSRDTPLPELLLPVISIKSPKYYLRRLSYREQNSCRRTQSEPEGVNTVLLGFTLPKRRRHPSLELFHLSPQSALSAVAAAASPVSHTLTTALKIRRAVPHDFVIH